MVAQYDVIKIEDLKPESVKSQTRQNEQSKLAGYVECLNISAFHGKQLVAVNPENLKYVPAVAMMMVSTLRY